MDFVEFFAQKDDSERRLDRILKRILRNFSGTKIYEAMRKRLILLNGKKVSQDARIFEGDSIKIARFIIEENEKKSQKSNQIKNPNENQIRNSKKIPFKIIFKNEHFLVIEKPYDLKVYGNSFSALKIVRDFFEKDFSQNSGEKKSLGFSLGALHRLDRKTSGILFFSQSTKGAAFFSSAIKNHLVKKTYIAILKGKFDSEKTWSDFLKKDFFTQKDEKSQKKFKTVKITKNENEKNAKLAKTFCAPIAFGKYFEKSSEKEIFVSLCKIQIESGRTHQIRAQCAFHGFPLLGDDAYGGGKLKNESRDFFLHAKKIEFKNKEIAKNFGLEEKIEIPLSNDFTNFIKKCQISIDLYKL